MSESNTCEYCSSLGRMGFTALGEELYCYWCDGTGLKTEETVNEGNEQMHIHSPEFLRQT